MDIRLVNREPGAGSLALLDASAQSEAGAATRPVPTGICLTGTALEKPACLATGTALPTVESLLETFMPRGFGLGSRCPANRRGPGNLHSTELC